MSDTYLTRAEVLALLPVALTEHADRFADVLIPHTACGLQRLAYLRARATTLREDGVISRELFDAIDRDSWRTP